MEPNKIEIQEAQTIPERGARSIRTAYPFERMEINESFIAGVYSPELSNRINSTIHYYSGKLKRKFCQRKVGENLTVWRSE